MNPSMDDHPDLIIDGSGNSPTTVALAHGAGAGMDTEFMNAFAQGLAGQGLRVVRFEFTYMAQRRQTGKRKPPDREPALRKTWLQVIESIESDHLVIGGKSMGGRIASMVADEAQVAGLLVLGYPFHPAGKPEKLRVEHLRSLQTRALFLQGERDALGNKEDVESYTLSDKIQLHWLTDGDHSFKPRRASGRSQADNWQEAIDVAGQFILSLRA